MQSASQRRTVRIGSPDALRARAALAATERPPVTAVSAWASLAAHAALAGALTLTAPPARTTAPAREFVVRLEPTPPPPPEWDAFPARPAPEICSVIEPPTRPMPDLAETEPPTPALAVAGEPAPMPLEVEVEVILPPAEPALPDSSTGLDYWADVRARLAEALRETPARWRGGESAVVWVTIELAEDGSPIFLDIADDAPRALAEAVRRALRRAAPFAAPPPGAPRRARVPIRFAG